MTPNLLQEPDTHVDRRLRRALASGYLGLAVFVVLGVVLETFHAFKWMGYLHVEHETRRLMLRLAHAHGTLLSVVQIVFALSARAEPRLLGSLRPAAMLLGQWMVPLGFLLGAIGSRGGDPGPLVALLPAGAVAWLVGTTSSAGVLLGRRQPVDGPQASALRAGEAPRKLVASGLQPSPPDPVDRLD
jgi:hypothetical protein